MPSLYKGNTKIRDIGSFGVYNGSTPIKRIYKGSQLVYQFESYTPNQDVVNISNGQTATMNFKKGVYHIFAQGGGGGGGNWNYWNNGGGGGSGAGFDGYIVFPEDFGNVSCTTGSAPNANTDGIATVINGIFNLGGGKGGVPNGAGAGGTYSYTSGAGYYILSSTVASNGTAGTSDPSAAGFGYGANSVLTGTGRNPSGGGSATALGAGGTGGNTSVNTGGKGSGGQCVITYIRYEV